MEIVVGVGLVLGFGCGEWPNRPGAKWPAGPADWLAGPVGPVWGGGCFFSFFFYFSAYSVHHCLTFYFIIK